MPTYDGMHRMPRCWRNKALGVVVQEGDDGRWFYYGGGLGNSLWKNLAWASKDEAIDAPRSEGEAVTNTLSAQVEGGSLRWSGDDIDDFVEWARDLPLGTVRILVSAKLHAEIFVRIIQKQGVGVVFDSGQRMTVYGIEIGKEAAR
jgi:hypothetical protein